MMANINADVWLELGEMDFIAPEENGTMNVKDDLEDAAVKIQNVFKLGINTNVNVTLVTQETALFALKIVNTISEDHAVPTLYALAWEKTVGNVNATEDFMVMDSIVQVDPLNHDVMPDLVAHVEKMPPVYEEMIENINVNAGEVISEMDSIVHWANGRVNVTKDLVEHAVDMQLVIMSMVNINVDVDLDTLEMDSTVTINMNGCI